MRWMIPTIAIASIVAVLDASSRPRQSNEDEFGQCSNVNFWDEQLGSVSVYAFLDAGWTYSYRQAVMLTLLKERLTKSGFTDIVFVIIASSPGTTFVDEFAENVEVEAWKQISILEQRLLSDVDESWIKDVLLEGSRQEIILLQDTPELKIWEKFRASKDQILVVDRCGRLTFQVIVPWSILYFPYVKAAILSTYKEDPCGSCDLRPAMKVKTGVSEKNVTSEAEVVEVTTEFNEEYSIDVNNETSYTAEEKSNVTISPMTFNNEDYNSENSTFAAFDQFKTVEFDDTTFSSNSTSLNDFDYIDANSTNSNETILISETINRYNQSINDTEESTEEILTVTTNISIDQFSFDVSTYPSNISFDGITETPKIYDEQNYATESTDKEKTKDQISLDESADIVRSRIEEMNNETEKIRLDNSVNVNHTHENKMPISNVTSESPAPTYATTTDLTVTEAYSNQNRDVKIPEDVTVEDETSKTTNFAFPLHIIMHAPHIHEGNENSGREEYLVLKTNNPDYHGHLELNDKKILYENNSGIRSNEEHSKVGDDFESNRGLYVRYKKGKPSNYIYNRDESPGLYGEIADYWRNSDENGATEQNKNLPSIDYEDKETETLEKNILSQTAVDYKEEIASSAPYFENNEEVINEYPDNPDDTERKKLIEHYNRLLPWIHYVLDK